MKNIAKILMVALLVVVATISVSAASVELNLVDAGTVGSYESGVYYLEPTLSDEHYANAFSVKFGINLDKIEPFFMDASGDIGDKFPLNEDVDEAWLDYISECVVMGTNGKTGLQKKTYVLQTVQTSLDGNMLYIEVVTSPKDGQLKNFPATDFKPFKFGLYITEDVTTLTSADFVVDNIKYQTWNGIDTADPDYVSVNWVYGTATNGTVLPSFTNNVVPEAVKVPTIAVEAGDVIYYADGTTVVVAEASDAYELEAEDGEMVYVNKGYTAQKVYNIVDSVAVEDEDFADGVVTANEVSIRDDVKMSGIRFKASFLTAIQAVVDNYGYLATVESAYNELEEGYVLDMALVETGKAVKAVAYDGADKNVFNSVEGDKTIVTAVTTGVPMDRESVTTKIVVRPYYQIDEVVVYGEPISASVAQVAYSIWKNDEETYLLYQDYIDEILELVAIDDDLELDVEGFFRF